MFDRLIHADWSANKKWMAAADRTTQGWQIAAPECVRDTSKFVDNRLFSGGTVLAGFDFPIGLPANFGKKTGFKNLPDALTELGDDEWGAFFCVAETPEQISVKRPFYPKFYTGHPRQIDLVRALGVREIDELRRQCERKTSDRRAACPLFWTLGGNQVGKAAIDGWKTVIRPTLGRGARLWPFHGRLVELANSSNCVLCETYPGEAYGHLGVKFGAGKSKRKQNDCMEGGKQMTAWAEARRVSLANDLSEQLRDGFGKAESGEDPFDACVGLLSMIDVVDGERPEGQPFGEEAADWEGWILGQLVPSSAV
jgi:hypothetical protein